MTDSVNDAGWERNIVVIADSDGNLHVTTFIGPGSSVIKDQLGARKEGVSLASKLARFKGRHGLGAIPDDRYLSGHCGTKRDTHKERAR